MAAGALAPTIVVGLLWRKPGKYSFENSMVTPMGARLGLILGTLTALIAKQSTWVNNVFGGPIIPAAVVTFLCLFVISTFTREHALTPTVKAN